MNDQERRGATSVCQSERTYDEQNTLHTNIRISGNCHQKRRRYQPHLYSEGQKL